MLKKPEFVPVRISRYNIFNHYNFYSHFNNFFNNFAPYYQDHLETYLQAGLLSLFLLCFIVQLYYLIGRQNSLSAYTINEDLPEVNIPISVIIAARNERENLRIYLPMLLEQNYPDFEVVVVNDCSYDGSEDLLKEFDEKYKHLKVVTITEHDRFKTGKKFALTLGIKAAKNEHLLFTDADCEPNSEHWITRMAANFTGTTQIVLGYSPYFKTGNFYNPFIRFETLKSAINYLSAAVNGDPYMGVGRNLAYTKTLFFGAKGFASHMHVMAGDDDLFVNQNARPDNTVIEIHPDSFIYTSAKTTTQSLFRQKKRHMGVGKLYKNRHRRLLSFDAASGFIYYLLMIVCLALQFEPILVLSAFAFRWLMQIIVYRKTFRKLHAINFLWFLPFFDLIYYLYLNVFGLIGTFIKTTQWK